MSMLLQKAIKAGVDLSAMPKQCDAPVRTCADCTRAGSCPDLEREVDFMSMADAEQPEFEYIVTDDLIDSLDDILGDELEDDYKLPDFGTLDRQPTPDIPSFGDSMAQFSALSITHSGNLFDERRKLLSDYVTDLTARVGGAASYDVRVEGGIVIIVATVRGASITGFRRKLTLSISARKHDSPRIHVEGVHVDCGLERGYIEVGTYYIIAVDSGIFGISTYKLPVNEALRGTYLRLNVSGSLVMAMEDALVLLRILERDTRIASKRDNFCSFPVKWLRPEREAKKDVVAQ